MPSQAEIIAMVRAGRSYEEIGRTFGIPAGRAYMLATGLPADGSDVLGPEALDREGLLPGGSQHLANPPTEVPTHDDEVAEWAKARARSDRPMQEAAARRNAEPPPIEAADQTTDVTSVLGWDHNQVNYLLEELETIPGVRKGGSEAQQRSRASIVDMIAIRLSEHEEAEEEHLWPAVRSSLSDGDDLADAALAQESEGKDLLHEFAGLSGTEERFDELAERLVSLLRKHVAFEDGVFLRLHEEMPATEREKLGQKIQAAKRRAPTRPHPHGPDRPPANKVAAAAAGPLDRARDKAGKRPAKRKGRPDDQPADGNS